jgi:hypothetical protein
MCCYCEEKTSRERGEVEHLRPKKRFPALAYDWGNLHWACPDCNGAKLEKYDEANPILDPAAAEPVVDHIEAHINHETMRLWLLERGGSLRGRTTISHAALNREELLLARMKIYLWTVMLIEAFRREAPGSARSEMTRSLLRKLHGGEFGFVTTVQDAFAMAQLDVGAL